MIKEKICCIYKIVNTKNNKYYIGSCVDANKRKTRHFTDLRLKRHHCIHLQRAYDKYGEDCFVFEIVKVCGKNQRQKLEQEYLDELDSSKMYNVSSSASGGDLIKNHPDREMIIKQKTAILVEYNKTDEARERNRQNVGEKNSNFGKRWSQELKDKVSKRKKDDWESLDPESKEQWIKNMTIANNKFWSSEQGEEKRKVLSVKNSGEGNPFYGKNHSEELKNKMSEERKGILINKDCVKAVVIEGIEYESLSSAARALNIEQSLLWHRLKSTNPKFKNWNYLGKQKEVTPPRYNHGNKTLPLQRPIL